MTKQEDFSSFMDAAVAGVPDINIDDYIENWHDDSEEEKNGPLHSYLGMTDDEYSRFVFGADEALQGIIAKRRAVIDGPQDGPITYHFGITGEKQMESGNSCQTVVESGHSVSIALSPPEDIDVTNPTEFKSIFNSLMRRLVDNGWKVDVQVGIDE